MHPGNIFVSTDGQYRAVDFGIMGTLDDIDKRYLAENFLGFFNRDYRAVADAHLRAGWIPRDTRVEDFEAAIRAVCEPIFAKPISQISFGRLLLQLFQTARRFNMEVQPQLVLLAEDPVQHREGLGPPAVSGARSVGRPPSPIWSDGCANAWGRAPSCAHCNGNCRAGGRCSRSCRVLSTMPLARRPRRTVDGKPRA